jgi:hypothetical protein
VPIQNSGGGLRYDWAAVGRYYQEGHSYRECRERFGFAAESWRGAVRRGEIKVRARQWPIDRLLREGRCRKSIKSRLLEPACSRTPAVSVV